MYRVKKHSTIQVTGIISSILLCVVATIFNPVSAHAISLLEITEQLPIVGGPQQPTDDPESTPTPGTQEPSAQNPSGELPPIVGNPSNQPAPATPKPSTDILTPPVQTPVQIPPIIKNPTTPKAPTTPSKTTKPSASSPAVAKPQIASQMNVRTVQETPVQKPVEIKVATATVSTPAPTTQVAVAQANTEGMTAKYMSEKISEEERNSLYKTSAAIALTGLVMFLLTLPRVRNLLGLPSSFRAAFVTN